MLYKDLNGKASVPTDDLISLVRRCRNHHSLAYQVPILILIFISVLSPGPLGIGMHFQTLSCTRNMIYDNKRNGIVKIISSS